MGQDQEKLMSYQNLIKSQRSDMDKIYLYVKDPVTSKYQLHINGTEKVGVKKI